MEILPCLVEIDYNIFPKHGTCWSAVGLHIDLVEKEEKGS